MWWEVCIRPLGTERLASSPIEEALHTMDLKHTTATPSAPHQASASETSHLFVKIRCSRVTSGLEV